MKKQFTEKDLVDFGNYLLSKKRTVKKDKYKVHQEDLDNFRINTPTNNDVIQACIDQIEDSGFEVGKVLDSNFKEIKK